jgi:hypothetical protein
LPGLTTRHRAADSSRREARLNRTGAVCAAKTWRRWLPAAVVIACIIGVPVIDAIASGAFAIPHGDDWAFFRIAGDFERSGHLTLLNWNQMTLIGHILWGVPFVGVLGTTFTAVHVASVTAATICLVAAYWLFRRFLPAGLALFGIAVFGLDPMIARLMTSYMTDLTGLAAQLTCLALGLAALDGSRRNRTALFAGALVIGFLGFTIREVSVTAPLAVLCAHALQARQHAMCVRRIGMAAAALIAASAVFYIWRQRLHNGGAPYAGGLLGPMQRAETLVSLYFTLALTILPAVALGAHSIREHLHSRVAWIAASVVAITGVIRIGIAPSPRVDALLVGGSYFSRTPGGPGGLLGNGPSIVETTAIWWSVVAVTLVAGACLAGLAAKRIALSHPVLLLRRRAALDAEMAMIWLLLAFSGGVVLLRVLTSNLVYDRYLVPLIPAATLIVLRWVSRATAVRLARAGYAALGFAAVLTFVLVGENNALSAGQWRAAERLVVAGFSPSRVAGGFEWSGLYYSGPIRTHAPVRLRDPGPPFSIYTGVPNCAEPSINRLDQPWMQKLGVLHYHVLLGFHTVPLWLYRNAHACSAADPSFQRARANLSIHHS